MQCYSGNEDGFESYERRSYLYGRLLLERMLFGCVVQFIDFVSIYLSIIWGISVCHIHHRDFVSSYRVIGRCVITS